MSKYIIIDLPYKVPDDKIPLIAFVTWLSVTKQPYTGHNELEKWGVDPEELVELTGARICSNGAIKLNATDTQLIVFGSQLERQRYYLDTDIFTYEYNIIQAFKERNPVWFIPEFEFNAYDEEMFNQLPETLQKWFIRKIHKGITTPAQELLKATYDKYVVKGVPLVSQFPTKERKCDQSKESDQ